MFWIRAGDFETEAGIAAREALEAATGTTFGRLQ